MSEAYIHNALPGEGLVKVVQYQGSNLHIYEKEGKKVAFAEVYFNGSPHPVFVQTRVPKWVK